MADNTASPLDATIELRPVERDDLEALTALQNRCNRFDGVPMVVTLEETEQTLDDEVDGILLATDTRVAMVGGQIAGFAYTMFLASEVREVRCYVWGHVDPDRRGQGIGRTMMAWSLDRATEQLRAAGNDLPKVIRTSAPDYCEDVHRLYRRVGLLPVRYMEELLRPLTDVPEAPAPISGLRIVPWPDDRDEGIRLEKNESFADHWGSTPTSARHWTDMVRGFGSRTDLSFIAVDDDDRVVGHCLCDRYPDDDELIGRSDGWIQSVGTLREWRGKGVASAMITHALRAFAAEGLSHASIEVDSANPSGAARLYRALGFERLRMSITSEILLDEPADAAGAS